MTNRPRARHGEDWQVSVESREGVSTGISAADRARTIQVLADPVSVAEDLVQPGHVVPIRARRPAAWREAGPPELALELCRLAYAGKAAALCQIITDDGEFADEAAVKALASRLGLHVLAVEDLTGAKHAHFLGSLLFPE
jgi:3,4-dihydroxy 2-butanone 4-phosphate synthase/GTP cyclohydrolase II